MSLNNINKQNRGLIKQNISWQVEDNLREFWKLPGVIQDIRDGIINFDKYIGPRAKNRLPIINRNNYQPSDLSINNLIDVFLPLFYYLWFIDSEVLWGSLVVWNELEDTFKFRSIHSLNDHDEICQFEKVQGWADTNEYTNILSLTELLFTEAAKERHPVAIAKKEFDFNKLPNLPEESGRYPTVIGEDFCNFMEQVVSQIPSALSLLKNNQIQEAVIHLAEIGKECSFEKAIKDLRKNLHIEDEIDAKKIRQYMSWLILLNKQWNFYYYFPALITGKRVGGLTIATKQQLQSLDYHTIINIVNNTFSQIALVYAEEKAAREERAKIDSEKEKRRVSEINRINSQWTHDTRRLAYSIKELCGQGKASIAGWIAYDLYEDAEVTTDLIKGNITVDIARKYAGKYTDMKSSDLKGIVIYNLLLVLVNLKRLDKYQYIDDTQLTYRDFINSCADLLKSIRTLDSRGYSVLDLESLIKPLRDPGFRCIHPQDITRWDNRETEGTDVIKFDELNFSFESLSNYYVLLDPPKLFLVLGRVFRELICNAFKHVEPYNRRISISINGVTNIKDREVGLMISNSRFTEPNYEEGKTIGLDTLKNIANALSGSFIKPTWNKEKTLMESGLFLPTSIWGD